MDERAFMKLEIKVEDLEKKIARIESESKELYGAIKELSGKISVNVQFEHLGEQIENIQSVNLSQNREIGELIGSIRAIRDVLSKSSDKRVAEAAQGLVINVAGGSTSNSVNFNDKVDRANLNTGGGTQHN